MSLIEKNRFALTETNVLKWQQDNLGEGSTIVVLDEGLTAYPHMARQVEVMTFGDVRDGTPKIGHGTGVMSIIYEVAPKARIVYFPFNNVSKDQKMDMLEWIIEHSEEIDVITMSMTWYAPTAREYFDTIKWLKIPFTVASGNDGEVDKNGVDSPADFDYTLAIGSASGSLTSQASYSNGGKELMCIAPVILAPNATQAEFGRSGTSFATPFVAGALALYTSWRRRNKLPKFTHDMAMDLIKENAKDITSVRFPEEYKVGHDYPTGWGLFRLPNEIPKVEVVIPEPEVEPEKPIEVEIPKEPIGEVGGSLRLVIDAGHGKEDTGAYDKGYLEKDFNLILAKRVRELLKMYKPDMTRTEDVQIFWYDRANMIKDKYDYCLSIHLNAGGGTGCEAIHSYVSSKGKALATEIVDKLSLAGIPKRPTPVYFKRQSDGQDYYYMHRLTGTTTTVIVEALFLDNDNDKMLLNIEKIAVAIAEGFKSFVAKNITLPTTPSVPVVPSVSETKQYKIRKFDSDIYVIQAGSDAFVDVDLGTRFKLEKVSTIVQNKLTAGEKVLYATNGGFFNFNGSSEHLGMYIDNGLYYTAPSINFVDFIYFKDGHTEIRNMAGYDQIELSKLQATAHWAVGTSYSLIKDGKINLMLSEKFDHAKTKNPRTMIGQRADGAFILAVADGRTTLSKGLTATEQAQVMLDLGCINAVNLDGGGSSTMVKVVSGKPVLVNKPSDGTERLVGSVFLVKHK